MPHLILKEYRIPNIGLGFPDIMLDLTGHVNTFFQKSIDESNQIEHHVFSVDSATTIRDGIEEENQYH